MRFPFTKSLITGVILCGAVMAGAQETPMEKLERENRQLKLQLENVNKSLAAALEREDIKTKALKEIKEHLALFGKDFFEGGDTKLRHAVTDYQIARESLVNLETAVGNLLPLIQNYLRTAVASDPEARKAVEVKIRKLEVALGQRQQPKRKVEQGTALEARIVTIDSNTGAVVVNAGSDAELNVGMRFRIERSGSHIGDAVVAVTRPNVSGLLMQSLINPEVPVQPGDFAKVITLN
ncbi:MAG: hypothetical protein OSB05_06575 [Akkermansiaceae bacterium]|nr:hypothetical protein [Akkermansiaceae bacterium]